MLSRLEKIPTTSVRRRISRFRRSFKLSEAGVRVGGDQLHPGEAPGGQIAPERQPAGAVLDGCDL